jgi:F-type H+-transporting ATPase subunit b
MMEQKRRKMIEETHKERDMILKEAKQLKDEIIAGAAEKAKEESRLLLEKANIQIEKQKQDALYEIKETIGQLSLEIAEKILREELSDVEKHKSIVNKYLNEVNFN